MTKLVCLHHAGGSPSVFRPWELYAPPGIEVVPITLPEIPATATGGTTDTATRTGVPPRRRIDALVPVLADLVRKEVGDEDFVLFGKSMGGLLAYLLTRHFGECGGPLPKALAVASFGAPHSPWRNFTDGYEDDRTLVRYLHEIRSIPVWAVEHPEWVAPYLGRLREDARMCAEFRFEPQGGPLAVPVRVFGGDQDPLVPVEAVRKWSELGDDVEVTILPGGHFLVSEDIGLLRQSVFGLVSAIRPSTCGVEPSIWRSVEAS
ncbi:thioesterase II family protein [Streptomyces sp. NPDC059479]|uniref:thioesterase II family protein n=1 Tax=Streptomyces sp. NPDC059479 TaxID=3346848 RepID=UPI00367E4ECD